MGLDGELLQLHKASLSNTAENVLWMEAMA